MGVWASSTHLTFIFVCLFACVPITANWDRSSGGYCIDAHLAFTILGIFFILNDALLLMLPMPYIWRTTMSRTRKWQLTGIFLLGSVVVFVAITRTCLTVRNSVSLSNLCPLSFRAAIFPSRLPGYQSANI